MYKNIKFQLHINLFVSSLNDKFLNLFLDETETCFKIETKERSDENKEIFYICLDRINKFS